MQQTKKNLFEMYGDFLSMTCKFPFCPNSPHQQNMLHSMVLQQVLKPAHYTRIHICFLFIQLLMSLTFVLDVSILQPLGVDWRKGYTHVYASGCVHISALWVIEEQTLDVKLKVGFIVQKGWKNMKQIGHFNLVSCLAGKQSGRRKVVW